MAGGDYILIFLTGLLGVIHCVGMCGGLIMACGMKCGGGFSFSLAYNAGRVFMYVILGLLMGALGKMLIATGLFGQVQGILPVAAGAFMVFMGLEMLGLLPRRFKAYMTGFFPKAPAGLLGKIGGRRYAPFLLGMVNGTIPCAFLYAVGLKAASTADPIEGMLVMASLGAGTFVPLLFTGAATAMLGRFRSGLPYAAASILVIGLGVKSIAMGTGLFDKLSLLHPFCSI